MWQSTGPLPWIVSAALFAFSAVNPLKAQSQWPQSAPIDELRAEGYPITSRNEVKTEYEYYEYEYYKRGGKLLLTLRDVPVPDIPVGATKTWNGQRIAEAKAIRTIAKAPIDEIELHETYFRADGKVTYEGTIIVYLLDSSSGVFGGGIEEHTISGVKRYGAFPDWPSGRHL